jgi:hypothetical protein
MVETRTDPEGRLVRLPPSLAKTDPAMTDRGWNREPGGGVCRVQSESMNARHPSRGDAVATTKSKAADSKPAAKKDGDKEPTAEERDGVETRTLTGGKTETVAVNDDPNLSIDTAPERKQASTTKTGSKTEAVLED